VPSQTIIMQSAAITPAVKRRPGRPPTYVFDRPDDELTENERRLRSAVLKRRERQNRSYRRRKLLKSQQLAKAHQAAAAAYIPPVPPPVQVTQGQTRTHHQPHLPALVRPYDSIPHPPPPDVSSGPTSSLRAAPLFLPRLHPQPQNTYGGTTGIVPVSGISVAQRLPPSSSSISNAPPVLPPPQMPHVPQTYDSAPYSFDIQQHQPSQPAHSHSLPLTMPMSTQHPAPPPPPPLHPETTISNATVSSIRQETAAITTGTLFSAPVLASKSEGPPDAFAPLNMPNENISRDHQNQHLGAQAPWARNYEQCGSGGLVHDRNPQATEPNHVHI